MARIAIMTLEAAGHLIPTGCVGLELQRRGHDVTVIAGRKAEPLTAQLGLRFQPLTPEGFEPHDRVSRSERLRALIRHGAYGSGQVRLIQCAAATFQYAPELLRELRSDAVIVDQNPLSGATIAEHLRLPYVTVFSALMGHEEPTVPPHYTTWAYRTGRRACWRNRIGYLGLHLFQRSLLRFINAQRAAWGLAPHILKADHYSPFAQISPLIPELDFPRHELPDVCHYVGSLGANRPEQDIAFPWDQLDGRPLIFASVGTMALAEERDASEGHRRRLSGSRGARLVLALGKWNESSGNRRVPMAGNPIVVDFAPEMALLKCAKLLITHAGQNTVLEAISQGVPMIALPRHADQPGMAARVEYAGGGLRDSFGLTDPAILRQDRPGAAGRFVSQAGSRICALQPRGGWSPTGRRHHRTSAGERPPDHSAGHAGRTTIELSSLDVRKMPAATPEARVPASKRLSLIAARTVN